MNWDLESPVIGRIFSDQSTIQKYLEIEIALAKVQADLGIIPKEAAKIIREVCREENINFQKYREQVDITGFPILPLIRQLISKSDSNLVEYIHYGATTQDIMDTAVVLQIKEALEFIQKDLDILATHLSKLALVHKDTLMVGRSQLQHALPITFGYKVAVWLSGINRHRQRLTEITKRVLILQFGGAVGTLASLEKNGLKVQANLSAALELKTPEIAWHTSRDTLAEIICYLGLITGSLAKIATDILLMTQTEVGELSEPSIPGRGESSTMPHKKNPIISQKLIVSANIVKQQIANMMEAMVQDHERSSGAWALEWSIIPKTFMLTGGALESAKLLLGGLVVHKKKMLENLQLTKGLILSEAVMMELASSLGRQKAHDLLHTISIKATEENKTFQEILMEEPLVMSSISSKRLNELLDPQNYLGVTGAAIDKVVTNLLSE